jgi:hypothetical protein
MFLGRPLESVFSNRTTRAQSILAAATDSGLTQDLMSGLTPDATEEGSAG